MKIMKLMILTFALLSVGCTSIPNAATPEASIAPFVELRANDTYFGNIETRNGGGTTGFVTWEPQQNRFIIRSYRSRPPVTLKMPSEEVTRFRFRNLTEEEQKTIEDQNK